MSKNHLDVWDKCLLVLKDLVNADAFKTWFLPINAVRLQDETLTIEVPNKFFYEYIEENYIKELHSAINQIIGINGKLSYQLKMRDHRAPVVPKDDMENIDIMPKNIQNPFVIPGIKRVKFLPQLNEDYLLNNLIEGDCNTLAKSAGKAVADRPGKTAFNPLFIYGDVGLGKTHLVQGIGNEVVQKHPNLNVLYVTAEKFTNQLIQAIKNGSVNDFVNFYQLVDVLIVDDIQFFAEKKKTQEIFFNVFNHLKQNGKQIILTADKPPQEIKGIVDRLISRFKWGLEADLHQPDLETRIAIMQAKMENEQIEVPSDVCEFICYHVKNNIRELEGVLIQLIAQATLGQRNIDLTLAKEVIARFNSSEDKELTVESIKEMVADHFGVSIEKLGSKSRKQEIATARHVSIYLSKQYTKNSLKNIGSHFGGRDHSTILHSCKTVKDRIDTDTAFKDAVFDLERRMQIRVK